MNKAFTLVELLVVVGIMGLLGTVSVGGYRAMQRGMEERGVMENVNMMVKAAYERAQIDRLPTMIYCWNETIRSANADENEIVVGRAVAVRRFGRLSGVRGDLLLDEFGDLDLVYPPDEVSGSTDDKVNTMQLYCLDDMSASASRKVSVVASQVEKEEMAGEPFFYGKPQNDNVGNGTIDAYGFKLIDANGVQWKVGSSYGFEFAEITLPKNYIFGQNYSQSAENPFAEAGAMVFKVGANTGEGVIAGGTIEGSLSVYSLRPGPSGALMAQPVAKNDNPL